MSTLIALARVLAAECGRAQPVSSVRHTHLSARPLVFVPLALAGEANAPLAALVGDDPAAPQLLTVAEPRDRDQRFAFAAALADIVLGYIDSFLASEEATGQTTEDGQPCTRFTDAPQLLLPNAAGVAFTRLLGRSTRFRRTEGPYPVAPGVPVLGCWLTFLADRAERPASSMMLALTDVLAAHWATGQSALEDQNLAAILGWIDPPDGLTGAQAAARAEDPLRCPPAGPTTDPTFDNEVLDTRLRAIRTARATGGGPASLRAIAALDQALATQLEPTWPLAWQAVALLRSLPPGGHVAARWNRDKDAFTWYAEQLREGGPQQPRVDGAVAAARRLATLEQTQAEYAVQRAFDDPLVMAEYRMSGEAFAGEVVAAEPARIDASGSRRKLRPRITVQTRDQVLAEPGAKLTSPARPGQQARVVSVLPGENACTVELELQGGMGRRLTPEPGTVPGPGERVCYATFGEQFQPLPAFPDREDTPWTHGGPPQPYVPDDEDAREDWS